MPAQDHPRAGDMEDRDPGTDDEVFGGKVHERGVIGRRDLFGAIDGLGVGGCRPIGRVGGGEEGG